MAPKATGRVEIKKKPTVRTNKSTRLPPPPLRGSPPHGGGITLLATQPPPICLRYAMSQMLFVCGNVVFTGVFYKFLFFLNSSNDTTRLSSGTVSGFSSSGNSGAAVICSLAF